MGFIFGFFNPRNVGIMGLIALGLYLNSKNEVNLDDYLDDDINAPQNRSATNPSGKDPNSSTNASGRSPASLDGSGLSFTDDKQSTLSSSSQRSRNNEPYERDRDENPFDDLVDQDNRRNSYRSANSARDFQSGGSGGYISPSPMINDMPSSNDSVSDNTSGSSFGDTNNATYLGGSFTPNPQTSSDSDDTADSDSSDNGGSSTGSSSGDNSTPVAPICNSDKASGTYISEFDINLTCNQPAKIYYCVGTAGTCCDPTATPTEYTGTISLGSVDDDYCLSFYGQSTGSLLTSDQKDIAYLVNSTLPSITTNFPKVQVQTTELPLLASTQSTDFGLPNHYLHQINSKQNDPSAMLMNCEDVYYDHTTLSGAQAVMLDYDVSGITPSDQVDQQITLPSLDYGDNFFTTILEDRDRMLMGCQQQNIILEDFEIFTTTASAPATPSSSGAFSGFVSYGHFESAPNTTVAGSGESLQATRVLEEGFLAITH